MYRHLSYEERVAIATLAKQGLSGAVIARRLGVGFRIILTR